MKKTIVSAFFITFLIHNVFAQWTKVESAPFGGNYYALAVRDNNIYAGTNFGLFHSADYGMNWLTIHFGGVDSCVKSIELDGNYLYLGTPAEGVFLSPDLGLSWDAGNSGLANLAIHGFTRIGSTVFVATEGGVFVSENHANPWTGVNNGITNMDIRAITSLNGTLFAGSYGGGVYVSTNSGQNWTVKNNGLASWYIHHLFTFGNKVFVGTDSDLCASSDNGNTWQSAGLSAYACVLSSTSINNYLYVGTDGQGVYFSTDDGDTWTEWNDGFENKNIYSLAIYGDEVFAGVCCGYGLWRREQLSVGIAKESKPGNFVVFPNPANDFISVKCNNSLLYSEYILINYFGQIIKHDWISNTSICINVDDLIPGIYFLKILSNKSATDTVKIVIIEN